MRTVVILGTGAVASELTSYIEDQNSRISENLRINIRGYIDYSENIEKYWELYKYSAPLLCDIDSFESLGDEEVLIGISDIPFRNRMIYKLQSKGVNIGSFIHSSVILNPNTEIGEGNIIYPYCIVGSRVKIGNYNMLTSYSCISHDCTIGDGNFFSTAVIAGRVSIGNNNFFGLGSKVIPYVVIGNDTTIQAGMMVDKNVVDGSTIFYRYKERVITIPKASTDEQL